MNDLERERQANMVRIKLLEVVDACEDAGVDPLVIASACAATHDTIASENERLKPIIRELERP